MTLSRLRTWLTAIAAACLCAVGAAIAQPRVEAVKADFLPKFPRYVAWPIEARPGPEQPFVLCVIGHDPFGDRLDRAAAAEPVHGRPIDVRRLVDAAEALDCHMAFVRGATGEDTARALEALAARPILTVTDGHADARRGMIHMTVMRGRVGFFIDEATAAARGLSISSRLLALARGVRQRRS